MPQLSHKFKGKCVEIVSNHYIDEEIKHKIANIGLVPGAKVQVLDYNKSNHVLHLKVCNVEYVLREKDCHLLYVKTTKK